MCVAEIYGWAAESIRRSFRAGRLRVVMFLVGLGGSRGFRLVGGSPSKAWALSPVWGSGIIGGAVEFEGCALRATRNVLIRDGGHIGGDLYRPIAFGQ